MSKRNIDKQVYEQYVDATVALFMEHYAAALTDATMQTETTEQTCPETLDLRCMTAIRKECAKRRNRAFWKGTKKVLSSAAIVLVALLSLSSILFMTVEAFRVPVINFFIEQGDGFWAITGKSDEDPIDPATTDKFDPNDPLAGLLPNGYKRVSHRNNLEGGYYVLYENTDGARISFSAQANSIDITLDSENTTIAQKCLVLDFPGAFVQKGNLSQLAWVDEKMKVSYILSADSLSRSDLFYIANNLIIKK